MLPTCSKNNDAVFVCQSSKCQRQNPFICNFTACDCNQNLHKDCPLLSWKKFKVDLNSSEKYKIQFIEIIEQLEIMRQDCQKNCDLLGQQIMKCKTFIAKNEQNRLELIKLIEQQELYKIHKHNINQYLQFNKISNEQSKLKDLIMKNVNEVKQNLGEVNKYFKRIYELDANLINSKIINSIDDVRKYFNKNIKQLKLLYRASDKGFSTEKFHKLCDNIPNTIIVIQTQFDTIFGGFSPSVWGGVGAIEDPIEGSFIFSLTHQQKMQIVNNKYSIFNCGKLGPIFGGGNSMMADFEICDRANQVRKSGSNFPINYNNSKKYPSGQSSIQHLTGQSKGRYFFVKQWEVFQVLFERDNGISVDQFLVR